MALLPFHLILRDCTQSGMEAVVLTRRLRLTLPTVPILLVSAEAGASRATALRSGATGVAPKTVSREILTHWVWFGRAFAEP